MLQAACLQSEAGRLAAWEELERGMRLGLISRSGKDRALTVELPPHGNHVAPAAAPRKWPECVLENVKCWHLSPPHEPFVALDLRRAAQRGIRSFNAL